ncbi:hypothetical protein [Streptomyces sp. NPDC007172]|uniref:hypothetical protein n=1 Tax=unclassified Streptomyces TaxID=2593676 RepID=UPI00367989CF
MARLLPDAGPLRTLAASNFVYAVGSGLYLTAGVLYFTQVVHTVGEPWHAAAGFEVSFALAPSHATGQYLGVFGLGAGLAEAVGPALPISLCITWGRPG